MDSGFQELGTWTQVLIYLGAFGIVAVAAAKVAGLFRRFRLPLITGFLAIGLISGPELLGLIDSEALPRLRFLNDIALAFIAFAVGSELYLKELRNRMKSIIVMTVSHTVILFLLVGFAAFEITKLIPFLQDLSLAGRISVSMLTGTIAIANSPAAAIAVIDELRARGPFTQTALGVTVTKDFIVIILFSVVFTLARSLIMDVELSLVFIGQIVAELGMAFGLGLVIWQLLRWLLSIKGNFGLKRLLVLLTGYFAFVLVRMIGIYSTEWIGIDLHVEPLLICIIGSFLVTNYSIYRSDFIRVLKDTGPYVYIVFFTLTGARISLDVVASLWYVTLLLFGARIISMIIASATGSLLAGDLPLFTRVSWMPYITQAGISMGLATIIGTTFPGWGAGLTTILISVIVLNEIVGPPLFKWVLNMVKEVHVRPDGSFEAEKKALIFGWENQSVALARQLTSQNWKVEIVAINPEDAMDNAEFRVHEYRGPDHLQLRRFSAETADTLICLLSDEENYAICETAYEHFGTRHLVVRLNERENYKKFQKLGAMVIDPTTAMVSLMEHFVRAPIATSLLLGMEEAQDSIDIELRNSDIHGLTLRDLRLPSDVIILSVTRGGQPIISHGYTRLRLGDIVTLVGSNNSLDKVRLNLQGY